MKCTDPSAKHRFTPPECKLFAEADPSVEVFEKCLRKYFAGGSDPGTLALLG